MRTIAEVLAEIRSRIARDENLRRICDWCGSPDAIERGNMHANLCAGCQQSADLTRDAAQDASATGPDPERTRREGASILAQIPSDPELAADLIEQTKADHARDARATGPDPERAKEARREDEDQGIHRAF